MDLKNYLNLLWNRKQTILSVVIICLAVSVVLIVVQTFKYGSVSRVLISQSFSPSTEAYNISQTNDYLGNLFAQVVNSNSFYEDVLEAGFNVDENYFNKEKNYARLMNKWSETVKVAPLRDGSGIVEVNVFHPDKNQVNQIAEAVNYVLKMKNNDYHGLGDKVFVRIIDRPIISTYPVRPNIFLIFPVSLILGFAISFLYIYLLPEEKYTLRIIPRRNGKKKNKKKDEAVMEEDLVNDNWQDIKSVLKKRAYDFKREGEKKEDVRDNTELMAELFKKENDSNKEEKPSEKVEDLWETKNEKKQEKKSFDEMTDYEKLISPDKEVQSEVEKILDSDEIEKNGDMKNIF
ncbi:hypothetical protein K8R62_02145 [bacterium]|nr:hypothetical protein [bacterium]